MNEESFFSYIKSDLARLDEPTLHNFLKHYLFPKGEVFRYQVWLRATHFAKKRKISKYTIGLFTYWRLRHYEFKYGIHGNSNIEIGKGLKIVHDSGIFLNCEKIGENCTFFPNVMLGKSPQGGIPIVEDNVTVYTGAVCVGNIILHNGAIIATNAFVHHDVESNVVMGGSPLK